MNYRDHCVEQDAPIPKEPIIFSKFPNAITGPYDDIILPSESKVRGNGGLKKPSLILSLAEELKRRPVVEIQNTFSLNLKKTKQTIHKSLWD